MIVSDRLRLRDFVPADVEDMVRARGERAETERLVAMFIAWAREQRRRHWQLAIVVDERVVGTAGIRAIGAPDARRFELGVELAAEARGRGLAADACGAMLRFAVAHLHAREIVAITTPGNASAIRLVEKLGMVRAEERGDEVLFRLRACPECGALLVDANECFDLFGRLLAWEVDDRALAAEHFLNVACWNVQHPSRFTDDVVSALRGVVARRLEEGLTNAKLRKVVAHALGRGARVVPREPRPPLLRRWDLTVADVVVPGTEGAAERVRAWAHVVARG